VISGGCQTERQSGAAGDCCGCWLTWVSLRSARRPSSSPIIDWRTPKGDDRALLLPGSSFRPHHALLKRPKKLLLIRE